MVRSLLASFLAALLGSACAGRDSDRDGLDDRLEARLARAHFPTLHEYVDGSERDECPQPKQRPVIYRARPRLVNGVPDLSTVAITYILLYEEDCGPLGHAGDSEAFTVFVQRGQAGDSWRTVGAIAIAHQGSVAEKVSVGAGSDIWISRNKHANFATFAACGDSDIPGDICAEQGPSPDLQALLNAGEPSAPMSNDVGDAYQLFRGRGIWDHKPFLGAGSLTAQLVLDRQLTAPLRWEAERGSSRKDDVK